MAALFWFQWVVLSLFSVFLELVFFVSRLGLPVWHTGGQRLGIWPPEKPFSLPHLFWPPGLHLAFRLPALSNIFLKKNKMKIVLLVKLLIPRLF